MTKNEIVDFIKEKFNFNRMKGFVKKMPHKPLEKFSGLHICEGVGLLTNGKVAYIIHNHFKDCPNQLVDIYGFGNLADAPFNWKESILKARTPLKVIETRQSDNNLYVLEKEWGITDELIRNAQYNVKVATGRIEPTKFFLAGERTKGKSTYGYIVAPVNEDIEVLWLLERVDMS